jgi:Xaa-Pro aminopeptidase
LRKTQNGNKKTTTSSYELRRRRFISQMLPNSVAFIVSNPEQIRSNDTEFPYRQSSDVLYLSNFPEPQSVLILSNFDKKIEFKMVVRPRDKNKEIWTGRRLGVEGAIKKFGAQEAFAVDQFPQVLKELLARAENVYYKIGRNQEFDSIFEEKWKKSSCSLHNPDKIVHPMRMVKDRTELDFMRHAGKISAQAHCIAMQTCRPGKWEYEIQAELEKVFRCNGASAPAYSSIVAGGNNAVILHYVDNNALLRAGELLLIDAACEFNGYASDITRTFPINGKFSSAQKDIYDLVLKAQQAAIARAKRGVTLAHLHETVVTVLRKGLIELGVLSPSMINAAAEEKVIKQKSNNGKKTTPVILRDLFMHGTSHWLGLDVHDVGTIGTRSNIGKNTPLAPGMVFTVEPGLYFDPEDTRLPKKYRGIGVRIEDDILVTANGHENLTAAVPKTIPEIEKLMSSGRR